MVTTTSLGSLFQCSDCFSVKFLLKSRLNFPAASSGHFLLSITFYLRKETDTFPPSLQPLEGLISLLSNHNLHLNLQCKSVKSGSPKFWRNPGSLQEFFPKTENTSYYQFEPMLFRYVLSLCRQETLMYRTTSALQQSLHWSANNFYSKIQSLWLFIIFSLETEWCFPWMCILQWSKLNIL